MQRLPFYRNVEYHIPDGFKEAQFSDIISDLLKITKAEISDGRIDFCIYQSSKRVTRGGVDYDVNMLAIDGQLYVYVITV